MVGWGRNGGLRGALMPIAVRLASTKRLLKTNKLHDFAHRLQILIGAPKSFLRGALEARRGFHLTTKRRRFVFLQSFLSFRSAEARRTPPPTTPRLTGRLHPVPDRKRRLLLSGAMRREVPMRRSLALTLLLALVAIACPRDAVASDATNLYYPEDGVVFPLADSTFDTLVGNNPRETWVVAFHTDGCVSCDEMAPHFAKAARQMRGIVKFGHVFVGEGSEASTTEIVKRVGLTKVPTVLGFPSHKMINPYTGAVQKQPEEFRNSTTSSKKLADFAASLLPTDLVTRVAWIDGREDATETANSHPYLPLSLLVTSKKETGSLMKSLALRFRNRVRCLEVREKDAGTFFPNLARDMANGPSFFTKNAGENEWTRHVGDMKFETLTDLLESVAAPVPEDDACEARDPRGDKKSAKQGGSSQKEKKSQSTFPELAAADFPKLVLASSVGQLVVFTRRGDPLCVNASTQVGKALVKIAGHVNAFEVNASDAASLELVKKYAPSLVGDDTCVVVSLFPHGDKGDVEPEYFDIPDDKKIDPKAFGSWVHEHVPDFVVSLSQNSVETFLQTSPATPKLVVFPKGDRPSRSFTALAANFQEDFLFASVGETDGTVAAQFGVTTRPAIRLLYLTTSDDASGAANSETGSQYAAAAYPAPNLAYQQMHQWLVMVQVQVLGKEFSDGSGSSGTSAKKPVEVHFADTTEQFELACGAAPLCVVAFVERVFPEKDGALVANEKDAEAVTNAAGLTRDRPAKFVMVDVAQQRSFAGAFEVSVPDAPCVTVVSTRKNRFATSRGAFTGKAIAAFLEDVLASKQKTQIVQTIPELINGGEGAAPPPETWEEVEEEFDLSDIMNEEVQGEVSKAETARRIELEMEEEANAAAAARAESAASAAAAAKKKAKQKKKKKKKKESEL